ncbi:MAG: HPr(Ser) kinase/phosphatase [Ignavibacteria bacterium]|jgi:HPr kinase/phosphorylase
MIKINQKSISSKGSMTVEHFFQRTKDRFSLKLLSKNKEGFKRLITDYNLHRPGLALAGFVDLFSFSRIQICGNTEMRYLEQLTKEERKEKLSRLGDFEIPCVIITDKNKPFDEIIEAAEKNGFCVFGSEYSTTKLTYLLTDLLEDHFAPRLSIHGSFVDVYGIGMLFVGNSGIGKSEVALDLVERGHRLVADDVVIFTKKGEGIIIGSGTEIAKHFMEVRGIGIIDIRSMFGIRAIRYQKRLEIIVEMEVWDDNTDYTRTGLDPETINILGINIKYIKLPIVPGKNLTVISEVIALNYLLNHSGYNAAQVFQDNLLKRLKKKSKGVDRIVDYFEHDFE